MVEGPKLVDQALSEGVVEEIYGKVERYSGSHVPVYDLSESVLQSALSTVSSQGVAAIARQRTVSLGDIGPAGGPVIVLAGVSDPGNAGTLLRAAEAVGAPAVLFCDGAVDPFSPKCVRASAGSIFRVPIVRGVDSVRSLELLRARGFRRIGTSAHAGEPYHHADLGGSLALVLGGEASGVPAGVRAEIDVWLRIPMAGRIESLNVAMAGTVILFEAARQRMLAGGVASEGTS